MRAALITAMLFVTPLAAEAADVKLIRGFEWEEFAPKVSRTFILGVPIPGAAKSGFRAEPLKKLAAVGPEGFQIFSRRSSRDHGGLKMVRQHVTQGAFAMAFAAHNIEMGSWRRLEQALKKKYPPPWPAHEPLYDPHDHWFQRMAQVFVGRWPKGVDWSGYDQLRFDVIVIGQPLTLGVRVRDGSGPRVRGKPTGVRTGLGLFDVPADKTVTVDLPLAEMARVAELTLSKVTRFHIRLNGLPSKKAPTGLFIDNIRLVKEGAEKDLKTPLVKMKNAVAPFARPVAVKPPTLRNKEKLKRELGPVEPLGPVVINKAAPFAGRLGHGAGHFGRSGATYFSNSRRCVVAYDNQRLCVVIGGTTAPPKSRKPRPRGGTIALASFDGGKTWGGLTPKDKDFTILPWYLRSNFFADRYGNLYAVGTPNCDSYREGQDICIHRLCFTGETWVDDRFAILHQDGYKCPANCQAIALANGRIWAAWRDGFGGCISRYSDDDGFTWKPCKDASIAEAPRPFHEPKLVDLGKPYTPPKRVLLWPSTPVVGPWIVPYKDQVAVFTGDGSKWAYHDGAKWSQPQPGAKIGGLLTVTVLGDDQFFLCRGGGYHNLGKEMLNDLVVADRRDGKWHVETLDKEKAIASAIITASGDAVYCFYVKKAGDEKEPVYEVRYRRFRGGTWEPSVKLATEDRRINHLAAPQICPPSYAAVFWDQHSRSRVDPSEVKFVRVSNRDKQ